mmetsp:Transcript_284/g.392  ORF Transcript_284/g.392 Transcript_284/m.392 type:complete len:212 (-) Transcript_284:135-770(-)
MNMHHNSMNTSISSISLDKLYLEEMKNRTKQNDLLHLKVNSVSLDRKYLAGMRRKNCLLPAPKSQPKEDQRKQSYQNDTLFSNIAGDLFVYRGKKHSDNKLQRCTSHQCMNMLLKKKLNRIEALKRSQIIPQRASTGSYQYNTDKRRKHPVVSSQNSTFPPLGNESIKERVYTGAPNNLFEQLRRSGMEEKLARRRQKNYSKLCQAVGSFE